MIVYKILREQEFRLLEKNLQTLGSNVDMKDGFIHLSTKKQLFGTLSKHFFQEKNLILMAIDSKKIEKALKWEEGRSKQLFPHLYSTLNFNDAVWYAPLELLNGQHIIPASLKGNFT